jgi:uncharacterized RmlC-like cupin family protein
MSVVPLGSAARLLEQPPSPLGLRRLELLPADGAPTQHLGVGLVQTPVGGGSPTPHHHGPAETGVYVLEGTVGFRCGPALRECVEAEPGRRVYIAPYAVHQEFNPDPTGPNVMVVVRDSHGSSFFPADVPDGAGPGATGVDLRSDSPGPSAAGADRVRMVVQALAPGEHVTVEPAGRETALAVLAGEIHLGAGDQPTLTAGAGQWFYADAASSVTVSNRSDARARLLVVQGPPPGAAGDDRRE